MKGWKIICPESDITKHRLALAKKLSKKLDGKDVVLCAILKGAIYFAVDLSRDLQDLGVAHSVYFVTASSYSGQAQSEHVGIHSDITPEKFKGKHVLLVDELFDNGKTMHTIKEHIFETACVDAWDITTCVMFRKRDKESSFKQPDFVGIDVPDVWLVGYGLDGDGKRRGVRDLYGIPPPRSTGWTGDDWKLFICNTIKPE